MIAGVDVGGDSQFEVGGSRVLGDGGGRGGNIGRQIGRDDLDRFGEGRRAVEFGLDLDRAAGGDNPMRRLGREPERGGRTDRPKSRN